MLVSLKSPEAFDEIFWRIFDYKCNEKQHFFRDRTTREILELKKNYQIFVSNFDFQNE